MNITIIFKLLRLKMYSNKIHVKKKILNLIQNVVLYPFKFHNTQHISRSQ